MKEIPAMFCDHANECPQSCPCAVNCYCRTRTCKSTPRIADLEHVRGQSTTLVAHVVDIVVDLTSSRHRYRWRCSCGNAGGSCAQARSARNGGAKHVAAMERGR